MNKLDLLQASREVRAREVMRRFAAASRNPLLAALALHEGGDVGSLLNAAAKGSIQIFTPEAPPDA